MKRTRQHVLEEESKQALRKTLPVEWIVRDIYPDYGLDVEVTIVEDEEVTNRVFKAQIKATDQIVDTQDRIHMRIKSQHLKYYENYPLPVFILYYVKFKNVFYYILAQKYVKEDLSLHTPGWRKQKYATVRFSSHSTLTSIEDFKSAVPESSLYASLSLLNLKPGGAVYFLNGIPKSDDQELKNLTLLALLHVEADRYQLAIEEFEHILKVCTTAPSEKMALLLNLGLAYYETSQYENALKNFSAANKLTSKMSSANESEGKALVWTNIGIVYSAKGRYNDSLKYFKKALRIFRKMGNRELEAAALSNIGRAYHALGDLKKAMAYVRLALKIFRGIGKREGEAKTLGNIAIIYSSMGEWNRSMRCQQLALKISREIGRRKIEAISLYNIGSLYIDGFDPAEAQKYYEQALKVFKEIGDVESIKDTEETIARIKPAIPFWTAIRSGNLNGLIP